MSGSRTIYVTGGRKDYARATLTDDLGHDLSTATIRLGLSTSKTTQPSQWYAPDIATFPTVGTAVLSLLVDSTRAPAGTYWLWADVVDSPTTQPFCFGDRMLTTI